MEHNILLVDDDPALIRVMARILSGLGQFRFATNGPQALQHAKAWIPDLIILDAEMPGMSGYQVCEAIKAEPALRDVPVIFATSHSDRDFEVKALELGAVDFLAKPLNESLAIARVRTQLRIKRLTDELRKAATKDLLTKLPNLSGFHESLNMEWARGQQAGAPMSLLQIQVDHFDAYVNTYGHGQAERRIREMARALEGVRVNPADLLARVDDSVFALLLPCTGIDEAKRRARQAIQAVEGLAIHHMASPVSHHITASVGISSFDPVACLAAREATAEPLMASSPSPLTASDLERCAKFALSAAQKNGAAHAYWAQLVCSGQTAHCAEIVPDVVLADSSTVNG